MVSRHATVEVRRFPVYLSLPHAAPHQSGPFMNTIPALQTERLVLRGFQLDDFAAMADMWTRPEIVRFIGGRPLSREQAWIRLLRHIGMWSFMGFGFWAITTRETGQLIGEAGFHDMKRDLTPSIEGTMEAGWGLTPEAQGQGYASEALKAALAWADVNHAEKAMTCIIDAENAPSIRLARKHGFEEYARATYHDAQIVIHDRKRPQQG